MGSVISAHTNLVAQKKILNQEGEALLASGIGLEELANTRSELWIPDRSGKRVIKDKCVTTAFVDFVVDQLQTETSAFGDFKYHEMGLGTATEDAANTALQTTTGIARVAGTQTETDHDTYKSVATITADASEAITEHGLFNTSTGGTMMDRTVFSAINVVSGNQVEFTFEISFSAGS